jgi:hypothetical protein
MKIYPSNKEGFVYITSSNSLELGPTKLCTNPNAIDSSLVTENREQPMMYVFQSSMDVYHIVMLSRKE